MDVVTHAAIQRVQLSEYFPHFLQPIREVLKELLDKVTRGTLGYSPSRHLIGEPFLALTGEAHRLALTIELANLVRVRFFETIKRSLNRLTQLRICRAPRLLKERMPHLMHQCLDRASIGGCAPQLVRV